jgi:MFS family permease
VWSLFNVALSVFLVFTPGYLVSLGSSTGFAGATVSLVTWTIIIFLPLGGWLAQRIGWPDLIMVSSFVAMTLIALALPMGLPAAVACLIFGVVAGPAPGLIMSLPSMSLEPQNRSAGMGVFFTLYYLGMATLVPFAGYIREWTNNPSTPLYFVAATMLAACAVLLGFRAVQRNSAA